MPFPRSVIATTAAVALGATAAVAGAQDVPPFEPEPTVPTVPTPTEPEPASDPTAPTISIALPKARKDRTISSATKRIRITMRDPDSGVEYAQVDVKRRIRLNGRVRDQAYDGRRWRTTTSATKYRIFPKVGARTVRHDLRMRKGLPAARYWITVKAQNDPGRSATRKVSFRTR